MSSKVRTLPYARMADAEEFIRYIINNLRWKDLSNDFIMDIGCGQELKSSKSLVFKFPKYKKVICVDSKDFSTLRIYIASNLNMTVSYDADVTKRKTLETWTGQITKIISYYCFNCMLDQKTQFQNIFGLLVPGGEAAILFTLQTDFFNWFYDISRQWPKLLSNSFNSKQHLSDVKNQKAPHYAEMFKSIGFSVLVCEDEPVVYVFSSDDECKSYLRQICYSEEECTEEEKTQFENDSFEAFKKYAVRNKEGNITMKCVLIRVLLEKPKD